MSLLVEIGGRIPVPAGGIFSFSPPGSQAATPTFSPPAGGYTVPQSVTLACSTPGSTIFYTTDGTTPTTASTQYQNTPLTIASTQTLSAIATAPGFLQSNVASGTYTIIGGGSLIQKKFNPGFGLMTVSTNGATAAEISTIASSGYINRTTAPTGAIGWYHVWYRWSHFEDAVLGNYNFTPFDTDMNNLQATAPGCGIMVSMNWYANSSLKPANMGTFNPAGDGIPQYILQGSSSVYGQGPTGSPYSGWQADAYNTSTGQYGYSRAAIWNANVLNRLQLFYKAFANHSFTITSGPFAGNWTVDTCPLVEGVGTSTPTDTNMRNAPQVPPLYSFSALNSAFQTLAQTVETYFPHTATFLMPGFGPNDTSGGGSQSAQNTLIHAMLANPTAQSCTDVFSSRIVFSSFNNPPTGGTLAGNFLKTTQTYPIVFSDGQIRQASFTNNSTTVTWSGALTGSPSTTAVIGLPVYAQYYAMGSNWDSTPGFQTPLLGSLPEYPTVQGPDLGITHNGGQAAQTGGANTGDSPVQTTNCINVAFSTLRATHVSLCVVSDTNGVTIPAYWNANVKPVINAYAIPTINKELPLAYMFGPPITSVTVASSTSLNVVYPNFTGTVGANMTYNLYRNGGFVTSLGIGGGTFADGGRTPGVLYTYTLQFQNDNGSGPVGPGVPATIPGTGPAITQAVAASATSVTLTWTPIAGTNNILVFRNGLQSGSPIAASAGTTVDTGLAAGQPYTYTLKVSNASGTGPAGAPLLWNNPVFNFPNFAGPPALVKTINSAAFVNNEVHLVVGGQHSAGGAGYNAVQNIQSFTCDFTFRLTQPGANGMFFVIQNASATTNPGQAPAPALSCSANGMGYASFPNPQVPFGNSIGIKFDSTAFNGNNSPNLGTSTPSSTGLYIDGGPAFGSGFPNALAPEIDLIPFGINVGSGNIMSAHLIYDGTILTMVISDTTTLATARLTWPVNIPAIVGANTAYLSFTAGTPNTGLNSVLSWAFNTGLNTRLAAPTFSVAAGQYSSTQSVSLAGPSGATIYYTTNGKQPTSASTKYTGPISVSVSTLVQAVAIQTGYTDSPVAQANYRIGTSTSLINFPTGFTSAGGLIQPMGYAKVVGSQIVLNDATLNIASAAWYADQVGIGTFDTSFDLSLTAAGADGCAFVLQNYPQTTTGTNFNNALGGPYLGTIQVTGGPFMLGQNAGKMSYEGIYNSIAIFFNYNVGTGNNTGLYQNGVVTNAANIDMTGSGVSLHAGHLLRVRLTYDGTTLVQKVTDTVNNSIFTHSYAIDIPGVIGASTAWAGFTCGAGGATANVKINAWTM